MSHEETNQDEALDPVEQWEALLDDSADQEAEDHLPTVDDDLWAQGVVALMQSKIAALRQQAVKPRRTYPGVTIPPAIAALDRAALLAQIEALRQGGAVTYAHQGLTEPGDDDLRIMLTLMTTTPTE